MMRPEDVDTGGRVTLPGGRTLTLPDVWVYAPPSHKNTHRGQSRWVVLGPRSQSAVSPLLRFTRPGEFVFRPREGSTAPNATYRTRSLHQAIERACLRASVPHWHPYQLRHSAAVRVKNLFGDIHARDVLGHADLDTTGIYTEADLAKVADVMRKCG